MKFAAAAPLASPEAAARKLVEIASGIEPVQDGRIYIELVNVPLLKMGGSGDQFRAGIALADERGWIELHESGTYVRLPRGNFGGLQTKGPSLRMPGPSTLPSGASCS